MSVVIRREFVTTRHPTTGGLRLRLAHLSDLHVWWRRRKLDTIAAILDDEQPDVVAFTGDWFDTPRGADLCLEFLQRITSTRPVCWIRGNHDHWFGPEVLAPLYTVPGAHCVDDASWMFQAESGHGFEFMSWTMHLAVARRSDQPRIVLVHDPDDICVEQLSSCDLVLAGHLHGGQFIFHRSHAGSHFPGNLLYRWCCDRREVGGVPVIISRGLGDTLPLRFRCPHEVVMVEMGDRV